MILAFTLFGREIPGPGVGLIVVLLVVGALLANRNSTSTGRTEGRGRMEQCTRCGRNFQPERVELLSTGDTRHFIDDRCPGCGWDLDWGDADKRPGGSGGRW